MADKHGDHIWYELMTSDAVAAESFYASLLGWEFADSDQSDIGYRIFSKNGVPIGGLMPLTSAMTADGARPRWTAYIAADDVDAAAKAAAAAGGSVLMEPRDMPNVGRIAYLADPDGVPFYVMKPEGEPSGSFAKHAPREGHCAWNELYAADPEAAKKFYGDLFGWVKAGEMDMGEMGQYEFLQTGDYTLGAVMRRPAQMPASAWVYYFRVPTIDAAIEQVEVGGGEILLEPQEIPGGDFVIQGLDRQGATFALIGKK